MRFRLFDRIPSAGLHIFSAKSYPAYRVYHDFSSMAGELCILEYISDGMEGGDNSLITVNKLFEQYIYAAIKYEILNSKFGVQEYIVARARKDRTALLRNAKIRISNIHPGRLLMNLRGMDKIIK
jgi:hypothetical protein